MPKVIDKKLALDICRKMWAIDASEAEVALAAGVSERWIDMQLAKDPALKEEKKLLKNTPYLIARKTIVAQLERDPEFALKYMKNKRNKEFNERVLNDNAHTGNIVISQSDAQRIIDAAKSDDDI